MLFTFHYYYCVACGRGCHRGRVAEAEAEAEEARGQGTNGSPVAHWLEQCCVAQSKPFVRFTFTEPGLCTNTRLYLQHTHRMDR